jgi:hypothetical protein
MNTRFAEWVSHYPPPKIGDRVKITFNKFGSGEVVDFRIVDGFLGMFVKLDNPPKWYINQCRHLERSTFSEGNDPNFGIFFGTEFEPIT